MYECFDIDEPEPYHSLSIITIIVDKGSFLVTKFISKSGNVLGTRLIFTKIKKKQMSNLTCKPTLIKVKYTWGILQIYWKYISKVYLKCPSIILETYFKFTSTILQAYFNLLRRRRRRRKEEEEVYFKSILFQQKEYIWSTFVKLNWLNLKYTSSILESYLKCTF